MCEVINHLLRHLVTVGDQPAHPAYQQLGDTNVAAHRKLLAAAQRSDAAKVRKLMLDHIDGAATGNWAPKAVIPLRDKPKGIIP
jgi:DNA-binding FadR family transcriptional regulator